MSFVGISFYVLSLLFGPCRLLEFTLSGPLFNIQMHKICLFLDFITIISVSLVVKKTLKPENFRGNVKSTFPETNLKHEIVVQFIYGNF